MKLCAESDLVEVDMPPDVAARIVSEVRRMRGTQAVPPEPVPVGSPACANRLGMMLKNSCLS